MKFRLKDNSKTAFGNALKTRAEADHDREWSARWILVCAVLDKALKIQQGVINSEGSAIDMGIDPPSSGR